MHSIELGVRVGALLAFTCPGAHTTRLQAGKTGQARRGQWMMNASIVNWQGGGKEHIRSNRDRLLGMYAVKLECAVSRQFEF